MTASLVSRMNELFLDLERAQLLEFQKRALPHVIAREHEVRSKDGHNLFAAEFPSLPTKDASSYAKTEAYRTAKLALLTDTGIPKFKKRLRESGNSDVLEAVIEAAQNVALRMPSHIDTFFDVMSLVPDCDLIHYAVLVSNYVKQLPLMHTTSELEIKVTVLESTYNLKHANIPNVSQLSSFFEKHFISSYISKQSTEDKFEPIPDFLNIISNYIKVDNIPKNQHYSAEEFDTDLLNRGVLNAYPGQVARVLSKIKSIYDRLGPEVAALWMRTANEIYTESKIKGNVFIFESVAPLIHYVKELGLNFDDFVVDYLKRGNLDNIIAFSERLKLLPVEKRRELVRYLAGRVDYVKIPCAIIPPQILSEVFELLPDDATTENLFDAFLRVEKANLKCRSYDIYGGIIDDSIVSLDKASSFDEFVKQLDSRLELVYDYVEFVREQRKKDTDDYQFDDVLAQKTLWFYRYFLGKNFAQFKRDFVATDGEIQSLHDVRIKYLPLFDSNKLKTVVNYVVDKRNKDLIWGLTENVAPGELLSLLAPRLKEFNRKEIAEALIALNRTHHFLSLSDSVSFLFDKLRGMSDGLDHNAVMKTISSARSECYPKFFGEDVVVPEHLKGMVDDIVVAYYTQSKKPDVQSALRLMTIAYLRDGPVKSFETIRNLDSNIEVRVALEARGVNVDVFERGIERTYHVKTDGNEVGRLKERIQFEFKQIYELLVKLEFDDELLSKLKKANYRSKMNSVEKFITEREFDEKSSDLKFELKGHVQTVRSLNGSIRSISDKEDDVKFYVSTDLFEALHMGQYFGTCLSLAKHHGGVNSWASVVQVMDSNKNVIYARDSGGNYVGRTRTVLTNAGILCSWFYQNGHLALDDAWISYLTEFGCAVGQDVLIPEIFVGERMEKILSNLVKENKALFEERTCCIDPAYFNYFYGDGLEADDRPEGFYVTAKMFVLRAA